MAAGKNKARFLRNRRLVHSKDYRRVMSAGLRSQDDLFRFFVKKSSEQFGRLGLTVSRRSAPRAVDRNRIKRAIRESFRHKQTALSGLDIVAIATQRSRAAENSALFNSLDRHWQNVCQK